MKKIETVIGILGTAACVILFIHAPSFPTPDKLLIFLIFIFMIFNLAWDMFKRLGPFIIILLVYDSFRSLVPSLNKHVHYTLMPHFDKLLFGTLPTITLQNWLWHGHVTWYDYVFYTFYMLHFVLPIFLAVLIYKVRSSEYWRFALTYITVSFVAFIVFILYPTAPPWLASQNGYIPHITRISSAIYAAMGIHNFPSIYNRFAPNPVAAVPSLHAAFSILFLLFVYKLFGKRWAALSLIYPICIIFGVVYMGEHYVFDVITGIVLAVLSYLIVPVLMRYSTPHISKGKLKVRSYLFSPS
jgi:membrane-associated phospholipid phosphatase